MADDKEAKARRKAELKAKIKEETKNLRVLFQYVIGVIVVLGGFVAGTAIGWASPGTRILKSETEMSESELAWIAAIFALGAAIAQFIVMFFIHYIGLKWSMVICHIIVACGWIPITISYNFWLLLLGRFVCGMAGGFCVACPTYIGETAHKNHRGTIGVFFQLFITGGILFAYIFGIFKNMIILNIACGAGCIVAIVLIILFVPESPYWLLQKRKHDKFQKIMAKFRGKEYDYSKEESEMQTWIDTKESVIDGFRQAVNMKAFGVLLGLHILQQLSGINAILYHAHAIFQASSTSISQDLSVIIIGIAQVLITFVAAVAVDRAGRILLFSISLGIMCICLILAGIYFQVGKSIQEILAVLPTVALVLYIAGFSLGTGPLPWAMLGEYLPSSVKGVMSTIIAFANWILAFGTSWLMPIMMANIPIYFIFYGFALVCFLGIIYLLLFVVETNRKTFEEIRNDIQNHKPGSLFRKKQEA